MSRILDRFRGKNVVIRTAVYHYVGRLMDYDASHFLLEDGAWVADSGRWSQFLAEGPSQQAEIEPFPDSPFAVGRCGEADICEWRHSLPRKVQ